MLSGSNPLFFSENINNFFQDIGTPFLDRLFVGITNAGSEPAYILLASLIFWCFNRKTGIRVMYVILFSAYAALLAKNLFSMPRPPAYLHKVPENSFGFPSGHALVSSGFWSYMGLHSRMIRIIIIGIIAVFLVSLSRIYLGVHYLGDVTGGIVLGLLVAFISYRGEKSFLKIFNEQSRISKYLIALFLPVILVLIASLQGNLIKEQIELGFMMASIGAGYLLEEEKIRVPAAVNKEQMAKRVFIGILFLGLIYLIFIELSSINPVFTYFRYGALGFSSVFIVPWIFTTIEEMNNKETGLSRTSP